MSKLTLSIDGMTCAACVRRVQTVLTKVPGVQEANVNLASRQASVDVADAAMNEDIRSKLVAAIEKAGFTGEIREPEAMPESLSARSDAEIGELRREFHIAGLLTLPVFIMEMGGHVVPALHHWLAGLIPQFWQYAFQAILATLVLAWPGRHFFTHGFRALFQGQPEMNSLVAVGAGSAWAYSMVVLLAPSVIPETARHVYFEAAAVIVTLILLGRLFEAKARGKTGAAIEHLLGLQPKQARLIDTSVVPEREIDVPIESIKPGDLLRVRPGEKIPVDGKITQGEPYIDQSMITGEPVPVALKPGETVAAGTINTTIGFVFKATHTGSDTVLARIIRMVQSAQNAKLPIQASVDKVTSVFVPVIMVIALITFLVWFATSGDISTSLVSAVAVLIIACPCAMGLATPTSIMVGTGRAAQLGVLFRQGDALQQLKTTSVVAFDKTGTLTKGHPALTRFDLLPDALHGLSRDTLLRMVAAIQRQSEHPIARAIVEAADSLEGTESDSPLAPASRHMEVQKFEAIQGFGVQASVILEGKCYRISVGSADLMEKLGISAQSTADEVNALASQGQTPIHVAVDGSLCVLAAIADPIKPESASTIAQLQSRGIRCAMITGDHQLTAQAVARALNIDIVHAQVRPEDKVAAVKALQAASITSSASVTRQQRETPNVVTFVGDGINDAPALAAADVGVAVGTGTDVAIESADVILMSGELGKVVTAIDISRATLRNIHQNLFWAFAYNAALVPIAAGVLYPINGTLLSPMLAAGAMAFSSLFVVSNALRLRWFKPASP